MKILASIILVAILLVAGLTAYKIRTSTHDPAVWHVDPLTAEAAVTPNHFRVAPEGMTEQAIDLVAPIYTGDITEIAQAFDTFVINQTLVERIAGTPEDLWMTYVQRTPTLRFPDYISVRFIPLSEPAPVEPAATTTDPAADPAATPPAAPGQVTVAIFSRSRFGNGDMGVNAARVNSWLKSLDAFAE